MNYNLNDQDYKIYIYLLIYKYIILNLYIKNYKIDLYLFFNYKL